MRQELNNQWWCKSDPCFITPCLHTQIDSNERHTHEIKLEWLTMTQKCYSLCCSLLTHIKKVSHKKV
jgi:hypothetical protein